MPEGYEILSLDDVEPLPGPNNGDALLLPLRHLLGFRPFGTNAWTAEVGKHVVPPHEEDSGDEELYVVVRGRATFTVDGETVDAGAGTLLHLQPGEHREAIAEEEGTIVLAVGATAGKAFQPRGWDDVVVAYGHGAAGRVDAGREIMRSLPYEGAPEWVRPYNLACYEARFGDKDEARKHLAEATGLSDDARAYAEHDSDLDAIR